MSDADDRIDLGPLAADAQRRAGRITSAVMQRISAARAPRRLGDDVRRQLARFALPAALAAAASLMLVYASAGRSGPMDRLARVLVPPSSLGRQLIQDQPPEIVELMVMLEPGR